MAPAPFEIGVAQRAPLDASALSRCGGPGRSRAKLKSVPEGDGTLLDNCMIAFGSAIADPNRHNHHDLPLLLVGGGGGTIKTGRYVRYKAETPLNNLWLAMLERFGATATKLGDSTGVLDGLS